MAKEKKLIDAIKHRLECHIAKVIHCGVDNIPMGKDSSSATEFLRGYERGAIETANILLDVIPVDAVEVVHGEWEPHPYHPSFVRCSACKERIIRQDMVDEEHFCSNCGAKMDGGRGDG